MNNFENLLLNEQMEEICFFWFRRDLRLNDNTGLNAALNTFKNVQPIFIFDTTILQHLPKDDARVTFIWEQINRINVELKAYKSSILVKVGDPVKIWEKLVLEYNIQAVYTNRDYEPSAISRDKKVKFFIESNGGIFKDFKDHVFFEKGEILKADGTPYTVYTPFKNKWIEKYKRTNISIPTINKKLFENYAKSDFTPPQLKAIGFKKSSIKATPYNLNGIQNYDLHRDFPGKDLTTRIGHHLRFGTVSVRSLVYYAAHNNQTYLSEIIWRDFFSQILAHFPNVINAPFKSKYATINWRNNEDEFKKWCKGETGYPIVDAGMRELNTTGFMHNRVRMITASFLVKHLLIDWRWGEAYFAEKLLDFDLASNNGNWQWAAGTGCDAAPYFRIFNPITQFKKFDPNMDYVKKWIPDYNPETYTPYMVDHKTARERALKTYKEALSE